MLCGPHVWAATGETTAKSALACDERLLTAECVSAQWTDRLCRSKHKQCCCSFAFERRCWRISASRAGGTTRQLGAWPGVVSVIQSGFARCCVRVWGLRLGTFPVSSKQCGPPGGEARRSG